MDPNNPVIAAGLLALMARQAKLSCLHKLYRKGLAAPHGFPDLILTSSQFLVRIRNENTYTMAAARGSLA